MNEVGRTRSIEW